jgi:hypothetical protein
MKINYVLLLSIKIFIVASACNIEGDCYNHLEVPVVKIDMPDSALIDTDVNIDITYVIYNNCSKYATVKEYSEADTLSLHVFATYEGCDCPDVKPDSIVSLTFSSKAPRQYFFRALKYDGSILQDTLTIYEPVPE